MDGAALGEGAEADKKTLKRRHVRSSSRQLAHNGVITDSKKDDKRELDMRNMAGKGDQSHSKALCEIYQATCEPSSNPRGTCSIPGVSVDGTKIGSPGHPDQEDNSLEFPCEALLHGSSVAGLLRRASRLCCLVAFVANLEP